MSKVMNVGLAFLLTWSAVGLERLEAQGTGFDPYLEVTTPSSPTPVRAGGRTCLAYEIHLVNFGWDAITVDRLEISFQSGAPDLLSWDRQDCGARLIRPGTEGLSVEEKATIPGGMAGFLVVWVPLEDTPVGSSLLHRLHVIRHNQKRGDLPAVIETTTRLRVPGPVLTIAPPLRGGDWLASGGPGPDSHHRRAWFAVDGQMWFGQRFAIDFDKVVEGPQSPAMNPAGDVARNESYLSHGEKVLAVADASVLRAVDGVPENVPGTRVRAVEIDPTTIMGNVIILDLGGGVYALYAHLRPGSLRVRTGDRVSVGQVLGELGNSGDSMGPHLHFQISQGVPLHGSDGLPFAFDAFQRVGSCAGECRLREPDVRRNEMPLGGDIIRFPQ